MLGGIPKRRALGCLNPLTSVGRLAWMSLLSGAAFAGCVWPGGLPQWMFGLAIGIWCVTALVWGLWIVMIVQMLRSLAKMKQLGGPMLEQMLQRPGEGPKRVIEHDPKKKRKFEDEPWK